MFPFLIFIICLAVICLLTAILADAGAVCFREAPDDLVTALVLQNYCEGVSMTSHTLLTIVVLTGLAWGFTDIHLIFKILIFVPALTGGFFLGSYASGLIQSFFTFVFFRR